MIDLADLRSYCDERARRHAEAAARAVCDPDRQTARARMREAMEIAAYIAVKIEMGEAA